MSKTSAQSEAQTWQINNSDPVNQLLEISDLTRIFSRIRVRNSATQSNQIEFGLGPKPTREQAYPQAYFVGMTCINK